MTDARSRVRVPSQSHRSGMVRVRRCWNLSARQASTSAPQFRANVWDNRSGPGGAGNTNRSLTPMDRLRRSEGCREGYPRPRRMPTDFGTGPVSETRKRCDRDRQKSILRSQGYVCGYCAVPFGSVIRKRNRMLVSAVHFDHMVPFAYLGKNPTGNWIAACNFCNQTKADKLFSSLAEARAYVLDARDRRGDAVEWFAPVSCEEDPERWAVLFASFLTRIDPLESVDREEEPAPKPKPTRARHKRRNFPKGPWSK